MDLGTMVSSVEGQSGCDGVVAASTGDVVAAGGCHGLVVGDGSGGVPGANCPVLASPASSCCSFEGAGSGWRPGSSASWPLSGWATTWWWWSSEPTLLGLSSGEVLVSGGLLLMRVWQWLVADGGLDRICAS
jgi:hypothetical protein